MKREDIVAGILLGTRAIRGEFVGAQRADNRGIVPMAIFIATLEGLLNKEQPSQQDYEVLRRRMDEAAVAFQVLGCRDALRDAFATIYWLMRAAAELERVENRWMAARSLRNATS